MLLTMPLASGGGDHLPTAFGAVLAGDSIGVTVPFVSFRAARSTSPVPEAFHFLLLIVGEGGNSPSSTISADLPFPGLTRPVVGVMARQDRPAEPQGCR